MTRTKGSKRRAPFLLDTSSKVKGNPFLTSSSASEAAQESDNIQGSFFTHYLFSGLRGAADTTRDGRVTLNEAYQFAFHQTLARTETSMLGPQHAAYDIQLSGTGDLVLTDLRKTPAQVVLDANVDGHLSIRDADRRLVAALDKRANETVTLGLEPGIYTVTRERDTGISKADIRVDRGKPARVQREAFKSVSAEMAVARGPRRDGERTLSDDGRYVNVDFELQLTRGVSTSGVDRDTSTQHKLLIGVFTSTDAVNGAQLGLFSSVTSDNVSGFQNSLAYNDFHGELSGIQMGSVNFAGAINGLQWWWFFNWSHGNAKGAHIGSFYTVA